MVRLERLGAVLSALKQDNTYEAAAVANVEKRASSAAWVGQEGNAPSAPLNDSFYTFLTPDAISNYSLGDIISYRSVGFANATGISAAWQLVYRSENSSGHAVGALTTIIVPEKNDNTNVIVSPQAEDSSFINCASSYELLIGGLDDQHTEYLEAGYVLNIPDHEGFNSSFTAGILEGKLTLDSIRALEASRNITGVENSNYAVIGYSGGSVASGWAAELQPTYAPELNIVGYAMGGFVANITAVVEHVNGKLAVGFVPAGILGLASEYPEMWDLLATELRPNMTDKFLLALSQCTEEDLLTYYGQNIFDYFESGEALLSEEPVNEIIANNTLGKAVPTAPMFIYNGLSDEIVPYDSVDAVVDFYCSNGANLIYSRGYGQDHIDMAYYELPSLNNYLAGLFAGDVPSGCTFNGVAPSFAGNFSGSYTNYTEGLTASNGSTGSTNGTGSSSNGSSGHSSANGSASGSSGSSGSSSANAAMAIQPILATVFAAAFALL